MVYNMVRTLRCIPYRPLIPNSFIVYAVHQGVVGDCLPALVIVFKGPRLNSPRCTPRGAVHYIIYGRSTSMGYRQINTKYSIH